MAELWREEMLIKLFEYSDELAELVLAEAAVPVELVRSVLREATLHRLIVPVLCGSALDCIGIQPLLDAVTYYLPSPADKPPVEGTNPKTRKAPRATRKPSPTSPSAAWSSRSTPTSTATCTTCESIPARSRPAAACSTRARTKRKTSRSSGTSRPTAASRWPRSRPATSSA